LSILSLKKKRARRYNNNNKRRKERACRYIAVAVKKQKAIEKGKKAVLTSYAASNGKTKGRKTSGSSLFGGGEGRT